MAGIISHEYDNLHDPELHRSIEGSEAPFQTIAMAYHTLCVTRQKAGNDAALALPMPEGNKEHFQDHLDETLRILREEGIALFEIADGKPGKTAFKQALGELSRQYLRHATAYEYAYDAPHNPPRATADGDEAPAKPPPPSVH